MVGNEEIKNKIIRILSEIDCCFLTSGRALSSKAIAEEVQQPYDLIKKLMRQLQREKLVMYTNIVYTTLEDYETQEYSKFRNKGWLISEEGRKTDIYKEEDIKERKIFEECFGGIKC